jgi:hypothetical protein
MIDVPDLNDAIRISERVPGARIDTIEVRPIREIVGLPED